MVMIPLLITFLSVLQVSTGVMARAVSTNRVQGAIATAAITGSVDATSAGSSDVVTPTLIDLPGGGSIVVGSRRIHQLAVSPLLPGGDNYEATGIAILE